MKKNLIYVLTILCLSTMCSFADCNKGNAPVKQWYTPVTQTINSESCDKPVQKSCDKSCAKKMYTKSCPVDSFLCTGKDTDELLKCIGLSDTQICTAEKINDKYQLEVLSLNEKINCENKKLYDLKKACNKGKEYRTTKREIHKLKKERRKICKCYEKQFKVILSSDQWKSYNKFKKN